MLLKKLSAPNTSSALPPSLRAPPRINSNSTNSPSLVNNQFTVSGLNLNNTLLRNNVALSRALPPPTLVQTRLPPSNSTKLPVGASRSSVTLSSSHPAPKAPMSNNDILRFFGNKYNHTHIPLTDTKPSSITVGPRVSPQIPESPDWTNDDPFDDDLIDVAVLGLQQTKRPAETMNHVPKRPRIVTSTQESGDLSHASILPPTRPSAGSKPSVPQAAASSVASEPSKALVRHARSKDTDVRALQTYILACEEKINLLAKCNAVSDSTSLSLDAKKHWHAHNFLPKMKAIDEKVDNLRSGFTFLEPVPTDLSNIHSDTSHSKTPSLSIVSSPTISNAPPLQYTRHIPVSSSHDVTQAQSIVSGTTEQPTLDPLSEDYDANLDEARRIVLERRNNPTVPNPLYGHIDDDDSEDNFGGDFMDGLQSSQAEDIDTDLSGFVANDGDDDTASVDVTYTCTQATQFERRVVQTDEDEQSLALDHETESIHNVLDDIRLSQDVAARFGVSYDEPEQQVEVIDEDFDDEVGDFTTQLNEGRDEVVEIYSDDDFNDEVLDSLKNWPEVKTEIPTEKVQVIEESDFSDDDDEILQLAKKPDLFSGVSGADAELLAGTDQFIDEVYDVLRNTFQLPDFRPNQLKAIVSTLKGQDVFVLIPTGGGKSLCYQLPALVTKGKTRGTTVVISPLISLMQDQIHHLQKRNIRADMISSRGSAKEKSDVLRTFAAGNLDLVYLSPEMVNKAQSIQRILARLYENNMLARIVVDEAHCVSSWGHDFRPDYQGMSMFKEKFPRVPMMALTATANEKVRLDIIHNLKMHNAVLLKQSFNRTNLFYRVIKKPSNVNEWLRDYILNEQARKTGIIYCHSKQSCETTSEKLELYGIRCKFYHAGMDADERLKVQTDWQENRVQVICATIAFGMGIDKPDVRFVVHIYLPRTLEGYYQETGRAGRDGKQSECIMFYAYKDARALKGLIEKDRDLEWSTKEMHLAKLRQVTQYCENVTDCRRRQVLHYFNEIFDPKLCKKNCDNCCSDVVSVTRDVTEHCANIVKLVQNIHTDKVTVIYCQDIYWGSKNLKIMSSGHFNDPYHGAGRELEKGDMERIFFYLQCENALTEYQVVKGGYATSYVKLGPNANTFMKAKKKIELSFAQPKRYSSTATGKSGATGGAKLNATGNGTGIANFRYQDSFRSAREVRNQEDAEKEGMYGRTERAPSRIVLPQDTFDGEINDSNKDLIEKAYTELRNFRTLTLQELGYGKANAFIGDNLLKEMAIKLPTNARDFAKLKSMTKEQGNNFVHFKKILMTLSRERKKSTAQNDGLTQQSIDVTIDESTRVHSSPYFKKTQTKSSKGSGTQKSQRGHKGGKKQSPQRKQLTHKPLTKNAHGSAGPQHIRQMPI